MSFRDILLRQLRLLPGSDERAQLASFLAVAVPIALDDKFTRRVAQRVMCNIATIAYHLRDIIHRDEISMPLDADAVFLEYSNLARFDAVGKHDFLKLNHNEAPQRMGCLIVRDPKDYGHLVSFMAWQDGSGNVLHSYALLHWRLEKLQKVVPAGWAGLWSRMRSTWLGSLSAARKRREAEELEKRLYDCAELSVPGGFVGEMEIMNGIPGDDEVTTKRAVEFNRVISLGEHVFLLAALVMMEGGDATMTLNGGDGRWAVGS